VKAKTTPSLEHVKAMRELRGPFENFMRNGVWGGCIDCPLDGEGKAHPEFCENAGRYDHHLSAQDLFDAYSRRIGEKKP
jgi:hypothetical protein